MPGPVAQPIHARLVVPALVIGGALGLVALSGCGGTSESDPSIAEPAAPRAGNSSDPVAKDPPVSASPSVSATAEPYGKSDAERMEDVHAIARALEEYRRRTGRLPFDETFATAPEGGADLAINVNLSAEPLPEEFRQPPAGTTGSVLTTPEFIEYMRKVMGPEFTLPTDAAPAPRFYQVHFTQGEYYVSAALFEPNEHTLPLADDWHKYQIGTRPDAAAKIRAVDEIERP